MGFGLVAYAKGARVVLERMLPPHHRIRATKGNGFTQEHIIEGDLLPPWPDRNVPPKEVAMMLVAEICPEGIAGRCRIFIAGAQLIEHTVKIWPTAKAMQTEVDEWIRQSKLEPDADHPG